MATKYWISTSSTSFTTAANWSDAAAPANGDTLFFNYLGTANVLTNLASTGLTGLTINKEKSYVGSIGSISGATATYLDIVGGTLNYEQNTGFGSASGSPLCMINFGATAGTVNSFDSSSTSSTGYYPPLLIKGAAGVTLNHFGGAVGVAALVGETTTLTAGKVDQGDGSVTPSLYLGPGVTVTALTANIGTVLSRSNNTTVSAVLSGTATYNYQGTGAHTTLSSDGAAIAYYTSGGTITTLNASGTFDRSRYTGALTITNTNLYTGYKLKLNNGVAGSTIFTNRPTAVRCSNQDGTIQAPPGDFI